MEKRVPNRSSLPVTAAVVLALAGCGSSAQVVGTSGSSKETSTNGPVDLSAKPVTSSASNTHTPDVPAKAALPSRPVSPFHIVADVDYELDLHRLGKNGILTASGQLLPIRDNTVVFDPTYALSKEMVGDGAYGAFESLIGVYPDLVFASIVRPMGRTGFTELYKWSGSKWVSYYNTEVTTFVLDVQPWQNGSVLMVESHNFSGEFRFGVLPKSTKAFVPEPHDGKWKGASTYCALGLIPVAFRTLPSGHVFMSGFVCSPDGGSDDSKFGIKRWSPDNKAGTADVLPEIGNQGFRLIDMALHTPTNAFAGGNTSPSRYGQPTKEAPYLAHFDGKSWTRDTLPFSDALASLDITSDGTLWLVSSKGSIFSRPAGGAWAEVALPAGGGEDAMPIAATTIWLRGPGDEWIVGTYKSKAGKGRHVVLHSGAPVEMAKLPDLEKMGNAVEDLAMPTPLTPRCMTPFVLLFTLSKVAPPDFDYPATRAALKGHPEFADARFIEFKRVDKRFMGAFVTDRQMGQKLVDLVTKKVPNSTPQLACHAPKPSRELQIDLK